VASDVYSLGATLLFAATGHAPYRGTTVMDVLARLATEAPDLSGLPDELTGLITACMHRVPRQRPTSSAMLAQLGDFTEAQVGPDEEHSYLPDKAMALIGEYQRSPQLAALAENGEDRGEDATAASYTELPASYKPAPRRLPKGAGSKGSGSGWREWVRTHLAWVGWASVGAALIVAGVVLGASLTSSSSTGPPPPPAAPHTVCGPSLKVAGGPIVCMNRSQGDSSTAFVVEGGGFAPRTPVTVKVSELDPGNKQIFSVTSPDRPVTGSDGTFKVPVSQLYSGPLPLGQVTVNVAGSDDRANSTQFIVLPPGAPTLPA
jgi:serine/threonine protein kinase